MAAAATQQVKSAERIATVPLFTEVLATEARACETLGHLLWDIREIQESSNNHHRFLLRTELKRKNL